MWIVFVLSVTVGVADVFEVFHDFGDGEDLVPLVWSSVGGHDGSVCDAVGDGGVDGRVEYTGVQIDGVNGVFLFDIILI